MSKYMTRKIIILREQDRTLPTAMMRDESYQAKYLTSEEDAILTMDKDWPRSSVSKTIP